MRLIQTAWRTKIIQQNGAVLQDPQIFCRKEDTLQCRLSGLQRVSQQRLVLCATVTVQR